MYDRPPSSSTAEGSRLTVCPVPSFESFKNPSQLLVFFMSISGWFPGFVTWLFDNYNDPGMRKLRWNRDEGRRIARKLIDSKRQELEAGAAREDIMSLIGLLLPFFRSCSCGC